MKSSTNIGRQHSLSRLCKECSHIRFLVESSGNTYVERPGGAVQTMTSIQNPKVLFKISNSTNLMSVHIYELCLGIFVQHAGPATLPGHFRLAQNVRDHAVRRHPIKLCLGT